MEYVPLAVERLAGCGIYRISKKKQHYFTVVDFKIENIIINIPVSAK